MTVGGAQPEGIPPLATESPDPESPDTDARSDAEPPRRLSLGDPWDGRATEDRPESWGERGESESDRLTHYRAETPPHHDG